MMTPEEFDEKESKELTNAIGHIISAISANLKKGDLATTILSKTGPRDNELYNPKLHNKIKAALPEKLKESGWDCTIEDINSGNHAQDMIGYHMAGMVITLRKPDNA